MNISMVLKGHQTILSVFNKYYYNESIIASMKNLKNNRICYVSLNKSSRSLENAFRYHHIKTNKVFFIDAVSQGLGIHNEKQNVVHVSSPGSFTELSIAIQEAINTGIFDVMLFDSLSTLNIYENKNKVSERFASHIIGEIRRGEKKGVFTCLEEDIKSSLIRTSCMGVDKVLRFNQFYQELEHKKNHIAYSTMAVFIGLFGSLLFLNKYSNTPNKISGYAVLQSGAVNPDFITIILTLVIPLLTIIFVAGYKLLSLKPVPDEKLKSIKPNKNINPEQIKLKVRDKIKCWFNKSRC